MHWMENGILCRQNEGDTLDAPFLGFKFVGHNVISNRIVEANDTVLIEQDYGFGRPSTNPHPVDSITLSYVYFWTYQQDGGYQSYYSLNRKTLELKRYFAGEPISSWNCSVYTETDDYITALETEKRQREEIYNHRLEEKISCILTRHE